MSLHVTIDSSVSAARTIARVAATGPLVILSARLFTRLSDEFGSDDAAMEHLAAVSADINRPVGVNFPNGSGTRTVFLAPSGWSPERLRGWVAGRHAEITEAFGPSAPAKMGAP